MNPEAKITIQCGQQDRVLPTSGMCLTTQKVSHYPYWCVYGGGVPLASIDDPNGWHIESDIHQPGRSITIAVPRHALRCYLQVAPNTRFAKALPCQVIYQHAPGWQGTIFEFVVSPPAYSGLRRAWETQKYPPRPPQRLGIGVITYNRLATLINCIKAIEQYTETPFYLVIGDDGSSDGTAAWARESGIPVVTGRNYGCAWNKNRTLAHLLKNTACDPILLLEEDCWPCSAGWEQPWIEAAKLWGHVNCMTMDVEDGFFVGGQGTAREPYWTTHTSGQCTITRRSDVEDIGYLDTRFKGWGEEHVEWTQRFWRTYQIKPDHELAVAPWRPLGVKALYPNLDHGLQHVWVGTYEDADNQRKNIAVRAALAHEPVARAAYRDDLEGQHFYREQYRAVWPLQAETGYTDLISVICPTKTLAFAQQLEASLKDIPCELIWVWNGAGECLLPGKVVTYLDPVFRYEEAINLGVMHSRGSVILIVNDDVTFTCDVAQLFQHLRALYRDNPTIGACFGNLEGPWETLYEQGAPGFEGCCWAISRRALRLMGGLEESLVEYGGDEIVTRARLAKLGFSGARLRGWTYCHRGSATYGPDAHTLEHMSRAITALGWQTDDEGIEPEDVAPILNTLWS